MFNIDVSPHTLTSEWIVMTNARVFHNNERTPCWINFQQKHGANALHLPDPFKSRALHVIMLSFKHVFYTC